MLLVPALLAIVARPVAARNEDGTVRGRLDGAWIFIGATLTVLIGFRFEVGGDWYNYLRHFNYMEGQSYAQALSKSEFSHWVVNKVMNDLGLGFSGVNFLYALFFTVGLVVFARVQPRPWLVLACAVPYLIIVVAMGYSRQAVALGFAFIGFVALRRGRFIRFSLWVLAGATFHNSAMLLIPVAGLAANRNRVQVVAGVGLISVLGYEFIIADKLSHLVDVYVNQQYYDSQGALIRLSMNALAALIFLNYRRFFALTPAERRIWSLTSLIALAMLLAYFFTGLSTALDRMALYLIPLQLVTAAHLPDALGHAGRPNTRGVTIVLAYFLVVQFVWLNFANHAQLWLPYQISFIQ
jgi:hypothetical protein